MKVGSEHLFPVYTVDAFATKPFEGNPAAVVFLMGPKPEAWLQTFAAEMNLSETAYFMRKGDAYQLRWFTPATEVDLCGHATLATAHVIWETGLHLPEEEIRFQTRSGLLRVRRDGDWIAMDFPVKHPEPAEVDKALVKALGAKVLQCVRSGNYLLAELEDEAAVRALNPDMAALKALPWGGVIVTAAAADPAAAYHFVSRFFGPALGVDEDPVTGSSHCLLAPFWSARLGQVSLTGWQASKRGGMVRVRLRGDRVELRGKAVTVMQGVIANG